MERGQDYADAGEDYYQQRDQRDREHVIRHHQQALARLGYQVTLIPPPTASNPPVTAQASSPPPNRAALHRRAIKGPASPGAAAHRLGSPRFVTAGVLGCPGDPRIIGLGRWAPRHHAA